MSPDSTRIAYSAVGAGLFVRPADGTGMPELLPERSDTPPVVVWSSTAADELIITDFSSNADIAVLSLAGDGERRPLLTTQFNEYSPALSPDGRWLAYQSDESGQFEIFVRPFREVGAGAPFTHETPKTVLDREAYMYNPLPPRTYDVSPEGQRLLMLKLPGPGTGVESPTAQFIVVTNWVEDLKRRVPTR